VSSSASRVRGGGKKKRKGEKEKRRKKKKQPSIFLPYCVSTGGEEKKLRGKEGKGEKG